MKAKRASHGIGSKIAMQDGGTGASYVRKVGKLNLSKTATTKKSKKATLKR